MSHYFRRLRLQVLTGGAQLALLAIGALAPLPAAWPISLVLVAAISLAAWIAAYRRLRIVEDTPTSHIASAAQGYVELSGRCESMAGAPTLAPYSHLPCAWCRYQMEAYADRRWSRVEAGETDASFLLVDASGRCLVDPAGAEIIASDKETWIARNYRYTEWRILPNRPIYVLGEFRTVSHEPSAEDRVSDTSALLGDWKRERASLIERFDRDRDGAIDLDEWQAVRLAARAEVEKNYREMQAAPELCVVSAPKDGRPYLISGLAQRDLQRMVGRWAFVHFAIFIAAMGGLGRHLVA